MLKELCEQEKHCCELLQTDILKDFVPRYNGTVKDDEGKCKENIIMISLHKLNRFVLSFIRIQGYIEMEDLLASFAEPCIMDCKIGVRTYLEEDLEKSERDPKPRAVRKKHIIDY